METKPIPQDMYLVIFKFYESELAKGSKITKIAEMFNNEYGTFYAESSLRNRYEKERDFRDLLSFNDRLDKFVDEPRELLTQRDLIIASGLNPEEFEIAKGNKLSRWWNGSRDEILDRIRNGSISIKFNPIEWKITPEFVKKVTTANIEPFVYEKDVETELDHNKQAIIVTLPDLHFGVNLLKDYNYLLQELLELFESEYWEEIIFNIGHDLFHNNDLKGNTANGTPIESVNMEKALINARTFYEALIESAIKNAVKVSAIYTRGNHDSTVGWLFCEILETKYPMVEFQIDPYSEFQMYEFHNVFLGFTHGTAGNDQKLYDNFNARFRLPMAKANRRLIFRGHKHTRGRMQSAGDFFGTDFFALGTPAGTDQWHNENGYYGNTKSAEIFIVDRNSLKAQLFFERGED